MAAVNSQKDLHKLYDNTPCPRCPIEKGSNVKTTKTGEGTFIRICSDCQWSVGVDDSVNLCDLGAERWTFHIVDSDRPKGYSCLKGKSHVPMFIGVDAESLMHSICINCQKTGIMFRADGKNDVGSNNDPPACDVDEMLRMIFANAMEKDSCAELESPIPDTVQEEIARVVDIESDEMIAELLSMNHAKQIECECGREECPECSSDSFAQMSTSEASEFSSMNVEPALYCLEKTPVKAHVRVTNLNQLAPGDHIAWDRPYAVWHHAIVMWVETDRQEIDVVHNSGGLKDIRNGHFGSVRQETVKVDCKTEFLYLYQYSDDECHPPHVVIDRAVECLNQPYNPFKFNCEHFARWCKAELKCCLQMEKFFQRFKMGSSCMVKFLEEWFLVALRILGNSETMGQILATGVTGARAAITDQLGTVAGSQNLFQYLGLGTMIGSIALSVATEVIFFIYKVYKARKAVDQGEMPWDDFQRDVIGLLFEGLLGLGGGLAVGFGFGLIPCAGPILSPLGYLLGNWIGRFLGAFFGRLVSRRLPIKNP